MDITRFWVAITKHFKQTWCSTAHAEGEDEMDIDDTTAGAVADESAYIGDNCLSTPVRNILLKNSNKTVCDVLLKLLTNIL